MSARRALDVSELPTYAFGHRDPMWWGVSLLIAIESTSVALLVACWLYIHLVYPSGPPDHGVSLPLTLATVGTAVLLLSAVTNHLLARASEKERLVPTRTWLIVTTLLGVLFLVLRFFELRHVNFSWSSHAYGSIYWSLLGLNIFHVGGGVLENLVLIALLFKGPVERKLMPDLKLDANYWAFCVVSWVVMYAVIYLGAALGAWPGVHR